MAEESNETRRCPECGKPVTSSPSKFSTPQICPNCKTRVYFLNYALEPIPGLSDSNQRPPKGPTNLSSVIILLVCLLILAGIVAICAGQPLAFLALGSIAFFGGVIGISIFLESRTRIETLQHSTAALQERVEFHESNQTRLVHLVQGYRTNLESITQQELASIQQHQRSITEEAESNLEQTASELELAQEQSGAAKSISERLLNEVRKNIKSNLTPVNYATQKDRFDKVVAFCQRKGFEVAAETVEDFYAQLKDDYEEIMRKHFAKEEQARIKAKIREEQRAERELEREMKRTEAEKKAIEKAIAEALRRTNNEHSTEVEELRRRLAEAEEKSQRAIARAQLTRAGHVYVISNVGSFGENVFKIGLTRRLEPMERVRELSNASVPFPFDVHMMISSDDAPALEAALHRMFHKRGINRANLRKVFFAVSIEEIAHAVQKCHGEVEYTASPEALEYEETQRLSDEDFDFISSTVDPETLAED